VLGSKKIRDKNYIIGTWKGQIKGDAKAGEVELKIWRNPK